MIIVNGKEEVRKVRTDIRLKCFHTNANSVVEKMSWFRQRSTDHVIMGITETWGNNNVGDAEITINDFNILRLD